jgi:hypothetical protein
MAFRKTSGRADYSNSWTSEVRQDRLIKQSASGQSGPSTSFYANTRMKPEYMARVGSRPSVIAALKEEGLIPA